MPLSVHIQFWQTAAGCVVGEAYSDWLGPLLDRNCDFKQLQNENRRKVTFSIKPDKLRLTDIRCETAWKVASTLRSLLDVKMNCGQSIISKTRLMNGFMSKGVVQQWLHSFSVKSVYRHNHNYSLIKQTGKGKWVMGNSCKIIC